MNVNVNFTGIVDEIIEDAIRQGLAKTKTEVLRLGLFELKNKYDLAQGAPNEEERKYLMELKNLTEDTDSKRFDYEIPQGVGYLWVRLLKDRWQAGGIFFRKPDHRAFVPDSSRIIKNTREDAIAAVKKWCESVSDF